MDVCVRRENRVPIFDHLTSLYGKTHSLDHFLTLPFEGGKVQS